MQLNVGIIAASIPALKPLLKKPMNRPRRNPYDDIEQQETIGSGKSPKPRLTFRTTKDTTTEMVVESVEKDVRA
jgi:hypothetical protein